MASKKIVDARYAELARMMKELEHASLALQSVCASVVELGKLLQSYRRELAASAVVADMPGYSDKTASEQAKQVAKCVRLVRILTAVVE